ncbi:hypothetical protein FAUST_5208 [Fusarium austroamericanum]|uniref:LysM domain-containing protein n=1 Tax=Fusarium austroamericanum TaxID=282268 RepID=A0AAN6HFQ3_FUSAU|nr:hypothetical protein FAUST_5208 [Fusarium austroamericanum]
MRVHTFISCLSFLDSLSSAASSRENSTRLGPFNRSKVQNSTEHELDLGTTPIAPYGEKQTTEEWATPLVNRCPRPCSVIGSNATQWTHIHSPQDLEEYDAPLLFDMNVQTETVEIIRVCALGGAGSSNPSKAEAHLRARRRHTKRVEKDEKPSNGQSVHGLKQHIKTSCGTTILFSKACSAIVGLYISADMGSLAGAVLLERYNKAANLIQVKDEDTCTTLTVHCNIRGADFVKHNPQKNLCATLTPGQWVCCSSGTLPDKTPAAGADVASIITVKDIEAYNKNSWAWSGCNRLQLGQVIFFGKGNTPMPSLVEDVACRPQKPGTKKPSGSFDGCDLVKLN